jgi:DNA-directed RNA polymerase sigma subunit (sigma70/sigma32)
MTIKQRDDRDRKIFELRLGIDGESMSVEEVARKYNLSPKQTFLNEHKMAKKVLTCLRDEGESATMEKFGYLDIVLSLIQGKYGKWFERQT